MLAFIFWTQQSKLIHSF